MAKVMPLLPEPPSRVSPWMLTNMVWPSALQQAPHHSRPLTRFWQKVEDLPVPGEAPQEQVGLVAVLADEHAVAR